MADDEPEDEAPEPPFELNDWTEVTEPYERALSALATPRGNRLSEIADKHEVDPDVLRNIAKRFVHTNRILIESDGEPDDPRLHRNPVMGFFERVWRTITFYDNLDEIEERLAEVEAEIEEYREETGYDSPDALVDDFGDADLSHIDTPDSGEIYWDVVAPWREILHEREVLQFTRDNYETLREGVEQIDIDGVEPYGDFDDINGIEAKLGVEDHKFPVHTDEDGNLIREDEEEPAFREDDE